MAIKGQKLRHYSEEIKKEIIRLQIEGDWTYRKITGLNGDDVRNMMRFTK
ncbi:hypothetical protein P9314_16555 [Paenibacillus validus]|uniref:Transposase n=1 Tax=Paenibacillus validus TaxID=44253 RepID=A0A7X2ZFU4_9BACL|nr:MULTISPECIES: hypothetical protein [Paenibacillus]MED4602296.1 hypothetical protein [Paenibacillus validus]MED4607977.1 hypothetical protein [Paenibacillus validus]MUG74091.1 hypothetical protein [Paenibacillus validus]